MANKENNKLKDLIKEYGIKDMNDVHNFVKMLMAETIQTALDAELDEELGYSKYDYKNKNTKNSRNGYSTKIVQSSNGEMELKIPRDRDGDFEPQLVKKHQTDISTIEDKVIFLYSQGVSTRDIQKTMQEMYGIDVDDSRVSKITDKQRHLFANKLSELPEMSKYSQGTESYQQFAVRIAAMLQDAEKFNELLPLLRKLGFQ